MQYTISNNLNEIPRVQQILLSESKKCGIDLKWVNRMNIVVDEILSNIVKYAYEKDANYQIEVIFEVVNPTKIKLRFVDRGKSFNPIKFKTPLISSLSEKLEEGGLGIHLVTNLVDSIEYLRTDDKNHLTVEMIIN